MSERNIISVDLGDVAGAAMTELLGQNKGRTQSDLVRDAILIVYQFSLLGKLSSQIDRAIKGTITVTPKKKSRKATDEERAIVAEYQSVYNYDGNIYWPPALSCIRSAHSNGLPYSVIEEIVRISPNEAWFAQMLGRGERPQLHMILSEKMIGQLLPRAQVSASDEADKAKMRLEGTVKPDALTTLKGCLTSENYSQAWDLINDAMTEDDVANIVKAAMEGSLKEYSDRAAEAIEGIQDVLGV
jgi:hypothetical protein